MGVISGEKDLGEDDSRKRCGRMRRRNNIVTDYEGGNDKSSFRMALMVFLHVIQMMN